MIEDLLLELKRRIEKTDYNVLKNGNYLKSNGNDNGFERLVSDLLNQMMTEKKPFNFKFEPQFSHHFPDINIEINNLKYGIELKSRSDGSFTTNGNSVFESISEQDYQIIYTFFGTRKSKSKDKYKIKYKPYWQTVSGVSVTHSPRFKISMNLDKSIFDSNQQYEKIREQSTSDRTKWVRKILNSQDGNKWYSSDIDNDPETIMPEELPKDKNKKAEFLADAIVHYPRDFIRKRISYNRTGDLLLNKYFVYSLHIRDEFSAGGKVTYKISKNSFITLPKSIQTINSIKKDILTYLNSKDSEYIQECTLLWEKDIPEAKDFLLKNNTSFEEKYRYILDILSPNIFSKKDLNSNLKLSKIILDSNSSQFVE